MVNPILESHFAPILSCQENHTLFSGLPSKPLQSETCSYVDVAKLPWARDGTAFESPACRAFARKEASWRRMTVTQPPIDRLDLFHNWECAGLASNGQPLLCGHGHEYFDRPMTVGLLWDWIEARLTRECSLQITIFPEGCSSLDDPSAISRYEKGWELKRVARRPGRGFSSVKPRIRIRSFQTWPGEGPSVYQYFDVPGRAWKIQTELSFTPKSDTERRKYDAQRHNGFEWLIQDCRRDADPASTFETWRWSRSDAFEGARLHNTGCGWSGRTNELTERQQNGRHIEPSE